MKRILLLISLLLSISCGGALKGGVIVTPGTPVKYRAVAVFVVDGKHGVQGAKCQLNYGPNTWLSADPANADGYVIWPVVIDSLRQTAVRCQAEGYNAFEEPRVLQTGEDEDLEAVVMTATHVDPWTAWTMDDILSPRGSLFTVTAGPCDLPFGRFPHKANNVIFFGAFFYNTEQRECGYSEWKKRGYRNGVMGPFVDPGYHGQVPGYDIRDNPTDAIASVQAAIDKGFVVKVVVVPDHWGRAEGWGDHVWTVADLRGSSLEAVYKTDAFQKIARDVMLCWECQGSQYGWDNKTYLEYGKWLNEVFPKSVHTLHTIADIEAPVGQGDETDTSNCHGLGSDKCLSNGTAWARVAQYFQIWLHQSSALFTPDHVADNGKTDKQNWLELWDEKNPASFVRRFNDPAVYKDWPKGKIVPIPGEYLSLKVYNGEVSEDVARDAGQAALRLGARGFFDGGREK